MTKMKKLTDSSGDQASRMEIKNNYQHFNFNYDHYLIHYCNFKLFKLLAA